jgi:hypothetical protein
MMECIQLVAHGLWHEPKTKSLSQIADSEWQAQFDSGVVLL